VPDTEPAKQDSLELHFFEQGEGEPIVFLHGFPLDHSMWDSQLEEFSRTHRVIAPDLRGFGESTLPEDATVSTMADFADDVAEALEAFGIDDPVTLCALSMGGYIAFQFWKRHPRRVRRLILCDTRAAADSEETRKTRELTAQRVLKEGPGFIADTMPQRLFAETTLHEDAPLVDDIRSVIRETSPRGIACALRGMAERDDFTALLGEIGVPTLLICGTDDVISPVTEMRTIADAIPRSRFVVIPRAGHMAPLEQPEAVNQAIREFLQESGGAD